MLGVSSLKQWKLEERRLLLGGGTQGKPDFGGSVTTTKRIETNMTTIACLRASSELGQPVSSFF